MSLDIGQDLFRSSSGTPAQLSVTVPGAGGTNVVRRLQCFEAGSSHIFEGDIIVRAAPLFTVVRHSVGTLFGHGVKNRKFLWTNGHVPFVCDEEIKRIVLPAIEHWMQKTPIRFSKLSGEPDCVSFESGALNGSEVGRVGGFQTVLIRPDTTVGTVVHEIGHALGLWHEHSRSDRASYITIHPENYEARNAAQFDQPIQNAVDIGAYDTSSIMHYPSHAFTKNGQPTITLKGGGSIGQRDGLSGGDVAAIRRLYAGLEWG